MLKEAQRLILTDNNILFWDPGTHYSDKSKAEACNHGYIDVAACYMNKLGKCAQDELNVSIDRQSLLVKQ